MMVTGPAASGQRIAWEELPEGVRAAVEGWLGSPVVSATTQPGGFSPGVASRLVAADGRRVFVKAVSSTPNRDAPRFHRREATIAAALPPEAPVPRLLWSYDEGGDGWIVLVFEDIDGHHPEIPWKPDELDRVVAALEALSESLTPSPIGPDVVQTVESWLARNGQGWNRMLEDPLPGRDEWSIQHAVELARLEGAAPVAARGSSLVHFDTRADNLLLTDDRVYVVDWPHAVLAQPWVELVFFAPSVAMQGGPQPEELLMRHGAARAANPDHVTAFLAAVAGFFTFQSLLPPPPGLPSLRQFQAAQGEIARRWLDERTGLSKLPPPSRRAGFVERFRGM
jgi:aminoglycoside phosphotransferase (APT) family kinase protein